MRRSTLLFAGIITAGCARLSPSTGPASPDRAPLAYSPSQPGERELLPDEQVQQVLNRLAFGARPGDAAKVRAIGVDQWIQSQLYPQSISDGTTDQLLARYPTLTTPTEELVKTFQIVQQTRKQQQQQPPRGDSMVARRDALVAATGGDPKMLQAVQETQRAVPELQSALLTRAVVSERQLDEVMVDFWENHFSVFANKGPQERLYLTEYDRDVIRPRALGKFRDLLGAVAHSSAMLFYLDNWESQADSLHPTLGRARGGSVGRGRAILPPPLAARQRKGLNENYARELMELHTLGVDGGYTQTDVIEVARALTGWSIAVGQGGQFIFRPEAHDAGAKTVLGHKLAAGRGEEDGEQVLDILARDPHTARFIATKLVRHFVADSAPPALVARAAEVFRQTDGDIRQVMATIVSSPEFYRRATFRSKVKTPYELVASLYRVMHALPDTTARSIQLAAQLGQPIFGHLTPEGWPDLAEEWMNTGAVLARINFGSSVATGRVPNLPVTRWPFDPSLRTAPLAEQVNVIGSTLLLGAMSPDTHDVLMSGVNPIAARSGGADAMPAMGRPSFTELVGLAIGSPEFQRR